MNPPAYTFQRSNKTGVKFLTFPDSRRIPVSSLAGMAGDYSRVPVKCETCDTWQPAHQMHPHPSGLEPLGLQCHTCHAPTARQLVREVAGTAQDFEFYPTSAPMIAAMIRHAHHCTTQDYSTIESVLDVGAGSGKVLIALRDAKNLNVTSLYAIEKSIPLIQAMPPDVMIVGTDLQEQSLLTKPADLTFCNPPYSKYEEWTVKIVKESTSPLIYLIIPQRWKDCPDIANTLQASGKQAKVIDSFDFLDAEDRPARAKVDLLFISDAKERPSYGRRRSYDSSDKENPAFQRQFADQFADFIAAFKASEPTAKSADNPANAARKFAELVPGESYPAALVAMYQSDLAHIQKNYMAASRLDPDLLREFDINPTRVCACLLQRLAGLRSLYWHQLFDRLESINARLTAASRSALLNRLHRHVNVDFTLGNIEAVVLWVLKNANQHFDTQLIKCFEDLTEKCNVKLYKSNQRVFVDKGWRYEKSEENTHYGLDYRIITHHSGGISSSSWSGTNGLSDNACKLLEDIRTVAANLGFMKAHAIRPADFHWTSGASHAFDYRDTKTGKPQTLFSVRAYGNGNMHFKFSQRFILALNVEHGRLKGWIRTPTQAAEEMRDPAAASLFKSNLTLPPSYNPLQLAA